ncbi:MAG: hypothetical protein A2W08_08470 [Candidatus Rokubacteria bacterium RBG_16_73_20]|nr:MAG: hypothetical protein A2W08_08470 [Candidatus Rokubacteria bacterium RBG_16_73_20]
MARAVTVAVAALLAALAAPAPLRPGPADVFTAMSALRPPRPVPAPAVPFRTLEGRTVRLGEVRGRPTLLGFFTTW